jgi:hypothetical protein
LRPEGEEPLFKLPLEVEIWLWKVFLERTETVEKYLIETDTYAPLNREIGTGIGLRYDYGKYYASKTFLIIRLRGAFCRYGQMSPPAQWTMLLGKPSGANPSSEDICFHQC